MKPSEVKRGCKVTVKSRPEWGVLTVRKFPSETRLRQICLVDGNNKKVCYPMYTDSKAFKSGELSGDWAEDLEKAK